MQTAAILDVDGTLVDSNYHHAIAWARAFREHGRTVPVWRIHRHIGMGGDKLVGALAGDGFEHECGDGVRASEAERFAELIDEVTPIAGARGLLEALREAGHPVVLASSAKAEEVEHYVDLLDARELVEAWTTSADVEATKPEADLISSAMSAIEALSAIMVGDTVWDMEAAARADIKAIGVLSGGFSDAELRGAGAVDVFESVAELREKLDRTPLR